MGMCFCTGACRDGRGCPAADRIPTPPWPSYYPPLPLAPQPEVIYVLVPVPMTKKASKEVEEVEEE